MATYVNDLRLKEIGTGESSGTWGTETNVNLELIAEKFGTGSEARFSLDGPYPYRISLTGLYCYPSSKYSF